MSVSASILTVRYQSTGARRRSFAVANIRLRNANICATLGIATTASAPLRRHAHPAEESHARGPDPETARDPRLPEEDAQGEGLSPNRARDRPGHRFELQLAR